MKTTLFDKIWDSHVVKSVEDGPQVLYIDHHFIHEVTSPVAFRNLNTRNLSVSRPAQTTAIPDHNIPTVNQHLPIADIESANQVEALLQNSEKNHIECFDLNHPNHGIVHVSGPEAGITQPGMTIVCGDSHTSTHGAFGAIAFGIGTSEVEKVFASQCIMQTKPLKMRIAVEGALNKGVTAKDIALYIISKLTTSGGTGYFIEFAGTAIESLTMEGRMTLCNMSIECGARGGMIAPDQTTFEYVRGREHAPKGESWEKYLAYWKTLKTDEGATFDKEYTFQAQHINPMITYGTNPGMGIDLTSSIPENEQEALMDKESFDKALQYMNFSAGESMLGKSIDYVFVGSCTNGRIEDLRAFTQLVKGHQKAPHVEAWIVPGSKNVEALAQKEGLVEILNQAGFKMRQPGCSACLAMNEDKIPEGKYAVSTSNRNFEGRQGPGARTLLASPIVAAAAAITGKISDPREFIS